MVQIALGLLLILIGVGGYFLSTHMQEKLAQKQWDKILNSSDAENKSVPL
jgi:hypothetical protein